MFMKGDKPVWVYLTVDPAESEQGRAVLAQHRAAEREAAEREAAEREALQQELDAIDPAELLRVWKAAHKKN